jgi:hypothetical protein
MRLWPLAFAVAAQALLLAPDAADALRSAGQQAAAPEHAPLAAAAAAALRRRPEHPALALWLADGTLAERLKWPIPLPLLAAHARAARQAPAVADAAWTTTCCVG